MTIGYDRWKVAKARTFLLLPGRLWKEPEKNIQQGKRERLRCSGKQHMQHPSTLLPTHVAKLGEPTVLFSSPSAAIFPTWEVGTPKIQPGSSCHLVLTGGSRHSCVQGRHQVLPSFGGNGSRPAKRTDTSIASSFHQPRVSVHRPRDRPPPG